MFYTYQKLVLPSQCVDCYSWCVFSELAIVAVTGMSVQIWFVLSPCPLWLSLISNHYLASLGINLWVNLSLVGSLLILVTISALPRHDDYDYYWDIHVYDYSFWTAYLGFLKLCILLLQWPTLQDDSVSIPSFKILEFTCCHRILLRQVCILNLDML